VINNIPQINNGIRQVIKTDFGYTAILAPSGDWNTLTKKSLALYRVIVLLSISEGSYPRDPKLGVKLPRYIFENLTDENIDAIREELIYKINTYEKDFEIKNINVVSNSNNKSIRIEIDLLYIPTNETENLSLGYIEELESLASY